MEPRRDLTQILRQLSAGDRDAVDQLWPLVYDELRRVADGHLRQERQLTLQPTALVHEAWLRFAKLEDFQMAERAQFFALAGKIMRSVLVDAARGRAAQKRGAGQRPATLTLDIGREDRDPVDMLALDEALTRLAERSPEQAQIVEMRFFGGLSHAQIAEALGRPLRTVERHWHVARVWLFGELSR